MDWPTVFGTAFGAIGGGALTIWSIWRYVKRANASDKSEKFSNDWLQEVIARQDREAERLRDEIRLAREGSTMLSKRVLELEIENKVARKVTNDLVEQVRLVKRDKLDPHDLHTNVFTDSGDKFR